MVLRGYKFVYKEHGSSKGAHDQPWENTGLTERHARMTKTQQIGHLKGKTTNPSIFIPDNLCAMVQPRKNRPYITERLLMGRKESNQTNRPETCLYGRS